MNNLLAQSPLGCFADSSSARGLFKEYLVQEYRDKAKGFVAMKFVDKNLNVLYTASVVFENNLIPKRLHKSFINISPKDLENRFNAAKDEICREILKDYTEKKSELEDKIKSLKSYWPCQLRYANNNVSVGVISAEFRGESINIVEQTENAKKQIFDM